MLVFGFIEYDPGINIDECMLSLNRLDEDDVLYMVISAIQLRETISTVCTNTLRNKRIFGKNYAAMDIRWN
jgi:hypothetical protein